MALVHGPWAVMQRLHRTQPQTSRPPWWCGSGCYLCLPLPFSCPSPASTCLGLLLPTSIHVHGIANDLASASLSPLLHRDTGCGFVAPACPAARLSRSVARLETPVSANQARPFVLQPRIFTGPCRIAFAEHPDFLPASSRPAAEHLEVMAERPGRY